VSSVLKTCSTVALSGRTELVVDTSDSSYRFLVRTSAPPPKNSNDAGDEDDESDEGDEDGAEIINKTAVALAREGHTSGYKEEYGQILTDMTGDGKDGHLFYERPLVQKRSGSSPKYELTPYGALVGYCMFSIQDIREWLHNSFFLPDTKTSSSELPDRYSTEQELIQLGLKTIGQNRDDA
jgi:hypothetical protein